MSLDFKFNRETGTQVAARFLELCGGKLNIVKLVKLVYILDRKSIDLRGTPIVGGKYFSMKHGPVPSEVYTLVDTGGVFAVDQHWRSIISERSNNEVRLLKVPKYDMLSKYDINLIADVVAKFGKWNEWQIVHWCHENMKEWTDVDSGREPITVECIMSSLGKPADEINEILREEHAHQMLDAVFA